jgi:hypothetical protein
MMDRHCTRLGVVGRWTLQVPVPVPVPVPVRIMDRRLPVEGVRGGGQSKGKAKESHLIDTRDRRGSPRRV